MENTARSERSRSIVIQAALAIIARDGPGRLTLDAIAREGGISKGGLMHQFRNKGAVLKALLEHQIEYFEQFSRAYLATATGPEPQLAAQIEVSRAVVAQPQSVAYAILGAVAEEPGLLSAMCAASDAKTLAAIRAEATDPDQATLRWMTARGLVVSSVLGLCPLSPAEREQMFQRLLDRRQWPAMSPSAAADPL